MDQVRHPSCDPLERLDIAEASALAVLMMGFRNRIVQNRCPCGQIKYKVVAIRIVGVRDTVRDYRAADSPGRAREDRGSDP
jgi:hypothetical protein